MASWRAWGGIPGHAHGRDERPGTGAPAGVHWRHMRAAVDTRGQASRADPRSSSRRLAASRMMSVDASTTRGCSTSLRKIRLMGARLAPRLGLRTASCSSCRPLSAPEIDNTRSMSDRATRLRTNSSEHCTPLQQRAAARDHRTLQNAVDDLELPNTAVWPGPHTDVESDCSPAPVPPFVDCQPKLSAISALNQVFMSPKLSRLHPTEAAEPAATPCIELVAASYWYTAVSQDAWRMEMVE